MSGSQTEISLQGELDLADARMLRARLSEAVGNSDADVLVNLEQVVFMDSTALGALIHAAEQMRRQGRRLGLTVRREGPVSRLLETAGVQSRFRIVTR